MASELLHLDKDDCLITHPTLNEQAVIKFESLAIYLARGWTLDAKGGVATAKATNVNVLRHLR